nr:periplasmic heavy metal sensor [uncultured Holophaga sp.]
MKIHTALLSIAGVGLLAAVPLLAQAGPGTGGGVGRGAGCPALGMDYPGMMGGNRMATALKLTPEQRKQMETIRAKHAVELTAKRQALRDASTAYHQACLNPEATPEQLRKLHQPVADRQFDLMLAQRSVRLEERAVLTPEQQAQADKFCQDMGPGRGGARGKGRGMGAGRW